MDSYLKLIAMVAMYISGFYNNLYWVTHKQVVTPILSVGATP